MKNIPVFLSLLLLPVLLFAQTGKVLESKSFKSSSGYEIKYSVYLPADYDNSARSYPVVYLLHGYSDDETGWVQFGEAGQIADKGISEGKIPPCILIIPDGKVTWYCNSYDKKDNWENVFIDEMIPAIEKEYRIRAKREYRAIAGLSMGGFGALKLSMRHPDTFASCVALSSGTFSDEEIVNMSDEQYTHYFGNLFGKELKGTARLTDAWKANSPLSLIHSVPVEKLKRIRFWIDCGDDDFLYNGNSLLHIEMRKLNIPHEYRVRDGSHQWSYWRSGLATGLEYIGEGFHR
ncbi:MAG: esterase family protein [Marinilabiliales bacterium]|nr:esterase family protein [Marinilabiliales bacterium]